jgi:hypothetical protein
MSSPTEQFSEDPDDEPDGQPGNRFGEQNESAREQVHRSRRSLQVQARATLAKKVAKAAKSHRRIAKATAQRARDLADLRQWSSDPVTAKLLNPDYTDGPDAGPAAGPGSRDADASRRKVAAWEDQEIARRTITSEVACTLHLADRTAANLIGEASLFAGPMKATLTAMSTGEISYRHGQVLMEQLSFMPLEEAQAFEAQLLPAAKDLTVGKLAGKARRLRERAHPATITKRATAAVADRGVWWEGRPDGMGTLTWYGTAQQTLAAHDRLTSIAQATQIAERQNPDVSEDQRRTVSQSCADAIGDLLLDGVTPAGTGQGIRGSAMVLVPVLTAMGKATPPASSTGTGRSRPTPPGKSPAARRVGPDYSPIRKPGRCSPSAVNSTGCPPT